MASTCKTLVRTTSYRTDKEYVNVFEIVNEKGKGTGQFVIMRSEKFISFSMFHRLTVEMEMSSGDARRTVVLDQQQEGGTYE